MTVKGQSDLKQADENPACLQSTSLLLNVSFQHKEHEARLRENCFSLSKLQKQSQTRARMDIYPPLSILSSSLKLKINFRAFPPVSVVILNTQPPRLSCCFANIKTAEEICSRASERAGKK